MTTQLQERLPQLLMAFLLAALLVPGAYAQRGNHIEGESAGANLTTGEFNTVVGDFAGFALTSVDRVTFLGYQAGYNTTAGQVVALGYQAGLGNAASFHNVFVGFEAGLNNIGGEDVIGLGDDNTFVGSEAGQENTTGYDNTFVGEEAGECNTTGYENTYVGHQAGKTGESLCEDFQDNDLFGTGFRNTGVGNLALSDVMSGFRNTAVGSGSLQDLTTGDRNTALGDSAGTDISDGRYNTMLGQAAGAVTEHASFNTFVGAWAGGDNNRTNNTDDANRNTYVGYYAGYTNREGEDNVGMGHNADFSSQGSNSGNDRNVFIGAESLIDGSNLTRGRDDNVIVGYGTRAAADGVVALGYEADVAGASGIAIGSLADLDNAGGVVIGTEAVGTGTNGIAVGAESAVSAENGIAIGEEVSVSAENEVTIGNSDMEAIGGIVNWTATSDARLKTDVREDVPGLSFVTQLRPVRYRFASGGGVDGAPSGKSAQWQTGFLAQEVESAAEAVGFGFSGVVAPVAGRAHYGLRYAEFVVPLTRAVQELDLQEQALSTNFGTLNNRLTHLEAQAKTQQTGLVNVPAAVTAQDVQQAEDTLTRLEALAAEH
ncbi:MAG: tail fiber domain-containing protein [Bacteroidota bacterium]